MRINRKGFNLSVLSIGIILSDINVVMLSIKIANAVFTYSVTLVWLAAFGITITKKGIEKGVAEEC